MFEHGGEDGAACGQDGFVRLELAAVDAQRHVAEALVLEEQAQVVGQPALGHFELDRVRLAADVHAVRHHAHLQQQNNSILFFF